MGRVFYDMFYLARTAFGDDKLKTCGKTKIIYFRTVLYYDRQEKGNVKHSIRVLYQVHKASNRTGAKI